MSDIATLTRSLEAERIARAEVERLLDERTRQLDISTRQLYETAEAYKDQIRRTHAIVDSAAEAIVIFDSHGTIDSFNPAAEVIFGCTAEEARERNITSFLPDVPFCNVELDGQVEILCDNGAGEIMGRKADGQNIPLELVIGSFEHDSNLFYTALMRDRTRRLQLETQLSHAQKMESVGQLAAGIAHEINTPIQYVGDNTRFLKNSFGDMLALVDDTRLCWRPRNRWFPILRCTKRFVVCRKLSTCPFCSRRFQRPFLKRSKGRRALPKSSEP